MSAQPQPIHGQPRLAADLIDRIANALPEELRVDYYRELSHCRSLPENDEMLRILRAMQFLTVLIERAPGQVATEREQLAQVLARGIESIQAMHQAGIAYQKQLEARIARLPEEIAKGISAEAIAAKLSESLRQQFQQTGLPAVAQAIGVQATTLRHTSKDLSAAVDDFAHPRTGVLARVNDAIRWAKSDLENATDHIRVQMNGLGKELYRTIAVLCFGALLIGLVAGVLYQRWLDSPLPHPPAQPRRRFNQHRRPPRLRIIKNVRSRTSVSSSRSPNSIHMHRDCQIFISVISKLLGWTLGLAIAGVFSIVLTPGVIISFIQGRRFIWWEYARWALTGAFLGVFVYELRNTGFHWQELYFLPILGAASLAGKGLSQIRADGPWRWLAWTPRLTGKSFHVDVAESQGMKLLRGSRLVHVTAARTCKAGDELIHWGGISIPIADECQHFLIAGKTGSGKSQAILALLRTVGARLQPALVADPGGAYLSRFGNDDSLILNPFDDRDAGWSPFAEIEWAYDCQHLAKATIPDVEGEAQQWHFYAQTLFAEVLRALWEEGRHSVAELLRLVMAADAEELRRTLAGTAAAILTARGNERMLANTRVICSTYLNAWRYLPEGGSFSVRQWVRQTARREHARWLYLVYRDDQMAMLRLLITTWLDLAIVETLSLPEQPQRRLWFVLDEWDSLGKVDSLRSGLTKLRKYGGAVVAGLQTMAQLRSSYGHDEAQVLLSCFSIKLILAAGDTETARYFEHELGTQELERLDQSRSRNFSWDNPLSGSQGTHEAWHRTTQSTVLASEISALPNLQGYLITMGNAIARIDLEYVDMPVQTEPFIRVSKA